MRLFVLLLIIMLSSCSRHLPPRNRHLSDPAVVTTQLDRQLEQWRGTPYRSGGLSARGVDCSGFVYLTFRDRFNIFLPRTTAAQATMGVAVDKASLLPGDLLFFKTGRGEHGLHVGIYADRQRFIHASTAKGVTRSSLNSAYWQGTFWRARRM